jgi:hypothetical protein
VSMINDRIRGTEPAVFEFGLYECRDQRRTMQ